LYKLLQNNRHPTSRAEINWSSQGTNASFEEDMAKFIVLRNLLMRDNHRKPTSMYEIGHN
jgi:hypothetical protein